MEEIRKNLTKEEFIKPIVRRVEVAATEAVIRSPLEMVERQISLEQTWGK